MLPSAQDERFEELGQATFCFACHPEVPCFNQCCRKLNLILTPYDVLRLKVNLGISSEEFVDLHTEVKPGQNGWPQVWLQMRQDDPEQTCPFLSEQGCSVYSDRPGACRSYPLGRAAKGGVGKPSSKHEEFFLVKEDHCQGFAQGPKWSPQAWTADQGLEEYNQINDLFLPLITRQAPDSDPGIIAKKMQMFFMACYNLETFRGFVAKSRFLQLFEVSPERIQAVMQDELELLKFAFDWLGFSIFGDSTMNLRSVEKIAP